LSWVEGYSNLDEFEFNYCISNGQKNIGEGRTPTHA